jgi:hypothetical protein
MGNQIASGKTLGLLVEAKDAEMIVMPRLTRCTLFFAIE